MKTNYLTRIVVLFAFASIVIISCKKATDPVVAGAVTDPTQTTVASLGDVVDYGLINSEARMMKMTMLPQNYTLYDSVGEPSKVMANVEFSLYVNDDGQLPIGQYVFSKSESKSAFTFDTGSLLPATSVQSDPIVDGNLAVSQVGNVFVLTIQGQLASGMTFSQSYNGKVSYTDATSDATYKKTQLLP